MWEKAENKLEMSADIDLKEILQDVVTWKKHFQQLCQEKDTLIKERDELLTSKKISDANQTLILKENSRLKSVLKEHQESLKNLPELHSINQKLQTETDRLENEKLSLKEEYNECCKKFDEAKNELSQKYWRNLEQYAEDYEQKLKNQRETFMTKLAEKDEALEECKKKIEEIQAESKTALATIRLENSEKLNQLSSELQRQTDLQRNLTSTSHGLCRKRYEGLKLEYENVIRELREENGCLKGKLSACGFRSAAAQVQQKSEKQPSRSTPVVCDSTQSPVTVICESPELIRSDDSEMEEGKPKTQMNRLPPQPAPSVSTVNQSSNARGKRRRLF